MLARDGAALDSRGGLLRGAQPGIHRPGHWTDKRQGKRNRSEKCLRAKTVKKKLKIINKNKNAWVSAIAVNVCRN